MKSLDKNAFTFALKLFELYCLKLHSEEEHWACYFSTIMTTSRIITDSVEMTREWNVK